MLATRAWPDRLFVLMVAGCAWVAGLLEAGSAIPRLVFMLSKPSALFRDGVGVEGALGLANNMLLSSRLALPGAGLAWTSATGTGSWAASTPAIGIAKAKPAGIGIGIGRGESRSIGIGVGVGIGIGVGVGIGIGIGIGTGEGIGMLDWPKRLLGSNPPALVAKLSRVVALSWPCVRLDGLVLGAVALPNRACMAVSARPWVRAKAARLARSGRGSSVVMTLSFVPREMTCSPASSMT